VAERVRYCGYVTGSGSSRAGNGLRERLGLDDEPFLLATGGGGGDGYPLLRTFLEALPHLPRKQALVVTGPLMSAEQQEALRGLAAGRTGIRILTFLPDLRDLFAEAEVVVSMCGYNTATELVDARARAVLVPRTWRFGEYRRGTEAGSEGEQLLRARALESMGLARVLDPGDLAPEALAEQMTAAMALAPSPSGLDLRGRAAVVEELTSLAEKEAPRVQA
jgi:predicted glycosyltransferase